MRKTFVISVLLILFITAGAAAVTGTTQGEGGSAENPYLVTNSVTYGEFLDVEFECVEGDCYDNLIEEEMSDYVIAVKQNGELISLSRDVNMQYDEDEGKFHYKFSTTDYLKFDDPDEESNSLTAGEVKFEFLAKTDATDDYEDMTKISDGTATVEPLGDMDPHRGNYLYIKANQNSDTLYMYILSDDKWAPGKVDDSDFDQGDAVVEEVDTGGWTSSSSKCAITFDKKAVNLASLESSKLSAAEYKKDCKENNENPKTLVENGFNSNYVPAENMVEEFAEQSLTQDALDTATPLHGTSIGLYSSNEKLARGYETGGDEPYWFVCREGNEGKTIDIKPNNRGEGYYTCEDTGSVYLWRHDEDYSEQMDSPDYSERDTGETTDSDTDSGEDTNTEETDTGETENDQENEAALKLLTPERLEVGVNTFKAVYEVSGAYTSTEYIEYREDGSWKELASSASTTRESCTGPDDDLEIDGDTVYGPYCNMSSHVDYGDIPDDVNEFRARRSYGGSSDTSDVKTVGREASINSETAERMDKVDWAALAALPLEHTNPDTLDISEGSSVSLEDAIKTLRENSEDNTDTGFFEKSSQQYERLVDLLDRQDDCENCESGIEGPGQGYQAADGNFIVVEDTPSPYSSDGCYEGKSYRPPSYRETSDNHPRPASWSGPRWDPGEYECPEWLNSGTISSGGESVNWELISQIGATGQTSEDDSDGGGETQTGGDELDIAAEELTGFSWKSYCANNQDSIGEDGINTDDGISASEAAECIGPSWGAENPDGETPHNPDVTHGELVKDFCEPFYDYDSDTTKCEVN